MNSIRKYELDSVLKTIILPSDVTILSVKNQRGKICVWAMSGDWDNEYQAYYNFYRIGTGNSFKIEEDIKYIDTVFDDIFVWHIFYSKTSVGYNG